MSRYIYSSLDEWIAKDVIPFSLDSVDQFNAAVDRLLQALGPVHILGIGEALHGGEEFLILRNRLFHRLVERHGFTAIAIESSYPRGWLVNDYVAGVGQASSYDDVKDAGISHGFGPIEANRELVEWMRQYNVGRERKLRFYGFDSPTEMTGADSPRQLLHAALDYLESMDAEAAAGRRRRIDELLGDEAAWANPGATFDASKSIGLSPAATSLRIETADLITTLRLRRPEFISKSSADQHREAEHRATQARWVLDYHALLARTDKSRVADALGTRDAMMAENLQHAMEQESGGRVLAFAHNGHLKRGKMEWQWGPDRIVWWPAGAQLAATIGDEYAVIGAALGSSQDNGVPPPGAGSIEDHLTKAAGPARFLTTHRRRAVSPEVLGALPARAGPWKNLSYFPFTAASVSDFDAWVALDHATYQRGGKPLPK
jgi:erythromycin esterase-like protein